MNTQFLHKLIGYCGEKGPGSEVDLIALYTMYTDVIRCSMYLNTEE